MIFNIVVDAVVRADLEEVCSPQEAQHGMVWEAGARNLVFYADDGRIAGRDHEWIQDAPTMTVAMFWRIGLEMNLGKNKVMVCTLDSSGRRWGNWPTRDGRREKGKPPESGRRQG